MIRNVVVGEGNRGDERRVVDMKEQKSPLKREKRRGNV